MKTRSNRPSTPARMMTLTLISLAAGAAQGQLHLGNPTLVYGTNNFGLNFIPGSGTSAGATLGTNAFTGHFEGDVVTSLAGGNAYATVYNGSTTQGAIIPFTVGSLPVRITDAFMRGNFKLVASGGDGVDGGGDPLVTAILEGRVYQQTSNVYSPNTDPWVSPTLFSRTYTQNGNGFQIVNDVIGSGTPNFVLTPGAYYVLETLSVQTSYTGTGQVEPTRGMSVEFGGPLTEGAFTGLNYVFGWQSVPAPGSMALLGLGGLVATRRRRA